MCCAIYQEPGKVVSEEIFRRLFKRNVDGFGMCHYATQTNEQVLYKELDVEVAYKHYKEFCDATGKNEPAILVFRYATNQKTKGVKNLHPFSITDKLAFVHDGNLVGLGTEKTSDTYEFSKKLITMAKIDENFLDNEMVMDMIIGFIEFDNRLIFLNSKRERYIYNENKGKWEDGIWYSNTQYKENVAVTTVQNYVKLKCTTCGAEHAYANLINIWYGTKSLRMCAPCFKLEHDIKKTITNGLEI